MSQVAGQPVVAAARVNVAGLFAFKARTFLVVWGVVIWSLVSRRPGFECLGLICISAVEYLVWAGLRRRGGPLGFGPAGGVIGVTPTTLFVSQLDSFTGRQTNLLGSWPREEVSMTSPVNPKGALRRFDLKFPGTEAPSRLELLQSRGKDDALLALFGGERTVAVSIPAKLTLWQQTRSRCAPGSKVPRALWWVATAIMLIMTQLALGMPSVMSSTDVLLRVATAVGCVAVVYAIHRRVDGN